MALGEKSHYVVEKPQWYHRLKSYFSKDGKLLGTELGSFSDCSQLHLQNLLHYYSRISVE